MRKSKASRVFGALFALVLFLTTGAVSSIGTEAAPNDVRNGVVPVVFFMKDAGLYATDWVSFQKVQDLGDVRVSNGSAFFIGESGDPQYLVTNYHVVQDYVEDSGEGGMYGIYTGQTIQGYDAVIMSESCELRVYYDDNNYDVAYVDCYGAVEKVDLAVLRLRDATSERVALPIMVPDESMVGETVYSVGFPGNAENEFTSASHFGVRDCTMHKGSINKFVVNEGVGVERINIDAVIQHGNSGGPLVTEDGYVIGVNTNVESNMPYADQIEVDYYAISGQELTRFLDKNNIPYSTSGGGKNSADDEKDGEDGDESFPANPGKNTDGLPAWLIVVIIVGAVVLVGVIILVIVLSGSKNKQQAQQTQQQMQAMQMQNQQMQMQNQMQMQQMQQQVQQQVAQAQRKKPLIRPMDTQHGGKSYPVGAAPIMIGRDTGSCTIVYKEGTVGVSGRHCTVSFDQNTGDFIVTDLRSTYGTCLMNGTKLQANAPYRLHAGDSFYVGDKANVIKVELV